MTEARVDNVKLHDNVYLKTAAGYDTYRVTAIHTSSLGSDRKELYGLLIQHGENPVDPKRRSIYNNFYSISGGIFPHLFKRD